jgi:hypothetical protein
MSDLALYDALENAATPAERDRLARECDRRATAFALAGQDR